MGPAENKGNAPSRKRAPSRIENGVTWWVRSTIRTSGATEYITPLQRATESSTTPKSVMKTMVGGYLLAASCATALIPNDRSKINAGRYHENLCLRKLTIDIGFP